MQKNLHIKLTKMLVFILYWVLFFKKITWISNQYHCWITANCSILESTYSQKRLLCDFCRGRDNNQNINYPVS